MSSASILNSSSGTSRAVGSLHARIASMNIFVPALIFFLLCAFLTQAVPPCRTVIAVDTQVGATAAAGLSQLPAHIQAAVCGHNVRYHVLWSKDQGPWMQTGRIKIVKYLTEHLALLQREGLIPIEVHFGSIVCP